MALFHEEASWGFGYKGFPSKKGFCDMSKRKAILLSCFALGLAGILLAANPVFAGGGNGIAPSGPHFDLNLIAVDKPKTQSNAGGGVIFVLENGTSTINLQPGPFEVLNDNATVNPPGALFQLPGPTTSGTFTYSVWARVVGTPGGSGIITPTFTVDGMTIASTNTYIPVPHKAKSTFQNVTSKLLFITYQTTIGGVVTTVTVPIFSNPLANYLWSYNNQGLKTLQLRFYQQQTK
jgi:hypothetical protein